MKFTALALALFLANLSAVTAQMNNVYCKAAPRAVGTYYAFLLFHRPKESTDRKNPSR
jgi:hypothetical protein